MRTREEIESETPHFADEQLDTRYLRNIQELLLDIRDLISKNN